MAKSPPYKKLLLASILVMVLSSAINELIPKGPPSDLEHDHIPIRGYVASKNVNSIWLSKEPVSIWERLTLNLTTSNYIIVSRHAEADNFTLFSGLKVNQRVRIYGDLLRESYPAKINAYYIEKITDDY